MRATETTQFAFARKGLLAQLCGLTGSPRCATKPAGGSLSSCDNCGQISSADAVDARSPTNTMPNIPRFCRKCCLRSRSASAHQNPLHVNEQARSQLILQLLPRREIANELVVKL